MGSTDNQNGASFSEPGSDSGDTAERYPELFKLFNQPTSSTFLSDTVAVRYQRKRGRPRKPLPESLPTIEDDLDQSTQDTFLLDAGDEDSMLFAPPSLLYPPAPSTPRHIQQRRSLGYSVRRNWSNSQISLSSSHAALTELGMISTPIDKRTPRSVINAHDVLMKALSPYTIRRAHTPREVKEILRKKRPCADDMELVLEYQEQMNILLRSELYFLQRIARQYGSCDQSTISEDFQHSSPWENDILPDLDELVDAAQQITSHVPDGTAENFYDQRYATSQSANLSSGTFPAFAQDDSFLQFIHETTN